MYAAQDRSARPARPAQSYAGQPYGAPEYPQDIRPLITRHRLRRRRRRKAATLLTGASIALGVAALRTPSASAAHAPSVGTPATSTHVRPDAPQSTAPG